MAAAIQAIAPIITTCGRAPSNARGREAEAGRARATPANHNPPSVNRESEEQDHEQAAGDLERLIATAVSAVPVIVLSMVPAWQFDRWQQVCFALATLVATWGTWPFHQRALRGLRHAAATMDTLVSLGVLASFAWSGYALLWGGAGLPGMRMPFSLLPSADDGVPHIYLEAAVAVPLFVLLGRHLEARARHRSGSALRALAELGARADRRWTSPWSPERACRSR